MKRLLISFFVLSIGSFLLADTRPRYIECQDSKECGSFACCVIGTKLYSLPQCMPYLNQGESCLDQSFVPINKSVLYLDGVTVKYTNVHILHCPCDPGLSCGIPDKGRGGGGNGASQSYVCFDPLLVDNLNSISNSLYDDNY